MQPRWTNPYLGQTLNFSKRESKSMPAQFHWLFWRVTHETMGCKDKHFKSISLDSSKTSGHHDLLLDYLRHHWKQICCCTHLRGRRQLSIVHNSTATINAGQDSTTTMCTSKALPKPFLCSPCPCDLVVNSSMSSGYLTPALVYQEISSCFALPHTNQQQAIF